MKLKDFNSNQNRGTNDTTKKEVREIPVSEIYTYSNVRKTLKNIDGLKQSIREHELIEPITIFKNENKYYIFVGHRRHRAFTELAKENPDKYYKIPCIIKHDIDLNELKEAQIVENIQRESFTIEELQEAFDYFKKEKKMTHAEIAVKLGVSEGYVKQISSTLKAINDNPKIAGLIKSDADITITDMHEVKSLPDEHKEKLIILKAEGEIKTTKELREKANEIKETHNLKRKTSVSRNNSRQKHAYLHQEITFKNAKHKARFFSQIFDLHELSNYERDDIIHYARCLIKFLQGRRKIEEGIYGLGSSSSQKEDT